MSRDTPLVVGLAAVLLTAATVAARQPTFRSGVDLVTVDASVLDADGRPIATLTAADFRLEVDGRERAIASAQFVFQGTTENRSATPSAAHFSSNEGADAGRVIVIAVDEAHIRRLEGRSALVSATRFIDSLPEADRVGVVGLRNAGSLALSRDRVTPRRMLERLTGVGDPMTQQLNLGVSEALEIADGSRSRLADAVLRECGRALSEYVTGARAVEEAGGGRDACPEQVEQESRAIAQFTHLQAGVSVAALHALVARLKDLPGPKTVVLVSEGMVVDPRRVDLSQLAADAHAARVTIYGLQLEVPAFEAAQERVSPTASRDLNVRHDGVARVAGAARGAVFRQVGTDPKPFERITRELSGHYLLAFEARDSDRDGRPHRMRLALARGRDRQLRARTVFTLPPATPAALGAELTTLLRSPAPAAELPLRVATYAYAEPSVARVRVVISAEAGNAATPAGTWLGFVLIDGAGVITATATHRASEPRYAFSTIVAPGRYLLRAAAIDPLGRQGSVERAFRVQPGSADQLHVGDLMLSPPPLSAGQPLAPFVDRVSGTHVVAYLETHASGAAPRPDAVAVHVTSSASTDAVVTARSPIAVREGGWAVTRTILSIAALPAGSYVARAEIMAGGTVVARTARPFTISR